MDKTSYDKRTHFYRHGKFIGFGIMIHPRWAHFERVGSVIRIYLGRYTLSHRTGRK